jgi:(S)-mandelate dehydrogenase
MRHGETLMHDTTAIAAPQDRLRDLPQDLPQDLPAVGKNSNPRYVALYRHYPTIDYLRRAARKRLPHFAFEYGDGGSGKDDAGIGRNWAALDAVELVPRYGIVPSLPPCEIELFGRRYAAPLGIAPMGGPAIVWPGADKHLARAAQRARVPYVLGMAGGATIEEIAEIAPDVGWFQL